MSIALEFFVHFAYPILFLWVLIEQHGRAGAFHSGSAYRRHPLGDPSRQRSAVAALRHRRLPARRLLLVPARQTFRQHRSQAAARRLSFEASTCVSKTEGYFQRRGAVTLLFAKFVPGLSTVAAPIAGQTGMPYPRFLLYDLAGSAVWASGGTCCAGFFFGDMAPPQRSTFFTLIGHFAVLIFVLIGLRPHVLETRGSSAASSPAFVSQRLEPAELLQMIETAAPPGQCSSLHRRPASPARLSSRSASDSRIGAGKPGRADRSSPRSAPRPRSDSLLHLPVGGDQRQGRSAAAPGSASIASVPCAEASKAGGRPGIPLVDYVPPQGAAELTSATTAA